jgi:hypothetical protein
MMNNGKHRMSVTYDASVEMEVTSIVACVCGIKHGTTGQCTNCIAIVAASNELASCRNAYIFV